MAGPQLAPIRMAKPKKIPRKKNPCHGERSAISRIIYSPDAASITKSVEEVMLEIAEMIRQAGIERIIKRQQAAPNSRRKRKKRKAPE